MIGSNTKVRKYLFSHITVFQISLSVRYTNTIEVTKFVQKNKKMKLTDVLLNQQIERRNVTTPIFTWQDRCVTGNRAGTTKVLRKDSYGSWWPLRLK